MQSAVKIIIFVFLFAAISSGQKLSRSQKVEELKKIAAENAELERQMIQINARRDQIAEDILAVSDKDRVEAQRIRAKAARLFPDGMMDKLIDLGDEIGFSVYSFDEISDYYFAPRIEYKNDSLEFDKELKEEGTHGFLLSIGGTLPETVNEQSREFIALAKYQPPQEIKDIKSEYTADGLTFREKSSVTVENTYLVRAVRYGSGDGIFAIKVHRKDTDGSIIIFVRTIKTFETPKLKNAAQTNSIQKNPVESAAVTYDLAQKIQNALPQKGFYDVIVDNSTTPLTLRGTVPKGKLAEVIQLVQEISGKPVKNELIEQ